MTVFEKPSVLIIAFSVQKLCKNFESKISRNKKSLLNDYG